MWALAIWRHFILSTHHAQPCVSAHALLEWKMHPCPSAHKQTIENQFELSRMSVILEGTCFETLSFDSRKISNSVHHRKPQNLVGQRNDKVWWGNAKTTLAVLVMLAKISLVSKNLLSIPKTELKNNVRNDLEIAGRLGAGHNKIAAQGADLKPCSIPIT